MDVEMLRTLVILVKHRYENATKRKEETIIVATTPYGTHINDSGSLLWDSCYSGRLLFTMNPCGHH
ncbi:hypothetical protein GHT06_020021 [Daphnia sinensis]|uniref:Uncharacterized protein n=1 Tax=Daphnia sinensis TaxID=1820382 RepID=A0AAD5PTN0_9CRUS|nr:hypothetical protein GHT06_020021 [Daphnia sinensis]